MSTLKVVVLLGVASVLFPGPVGATTYYVRTDGNDGNDGLSNDAGGAWQTIDHAADSVSAGDVIRVQTGVYEERVTPGVNGSSVTERVTFVADGEVIMCGWDITDGSYLRIIGFTMDSDEGSCSMSNGCVLITGTANAHLEFWNNVFRDGNYNGIRVGTFDQYDNSVIVGNTFSNFGVGNGSGMAVNVVGSNNLIAYNEVYNSCPDAFLMRGRNNRWTNNYIHDLNESYGGHADGFQTGSHDLGWEHNLFEANIEVGVGDAGDEHVAQISHAQAATYCPTGCGDMTENIFRRNVWHNISSGGIGINQVDDGPITYTRYYHNTTAEAQENYASNRYGLAWYGTLFNDAYLLNNIELENWGDDATSGLLVYCLSLNTSCDYAGVRYVLDYNLAYDPQGDVSFDGPFDAQPHGQLNVDPRFVDYDNDEFQLQGSSGAIDAAGPLTHVNEPSDTNGTSFDVDDAGYFRGDNPNLTQYDGNLVVGDLITVGTDTVRISSLSGNTITVSESFTWADGEPVYYGDDTTPDIGAHPYSPGGYDLTATYTVSSDVVDVSPSNADLVRMVVVFEDRIPVGVDSIRPYSVSGVGDGELDVWVYKRYASTAPIVVAAPSSGTDAGVSDAGAADSGAPVDAGSAETDSGGCSCRSQGAGSASVPLGLMLLLLGLYVCRKRAAV